VNLLELQRQMSADVQRPLAPGFQMQAQTEDGRSLSDLAAAYIKPNDRLTSFERLEIYNRQYWFRVIGAISEDFPALNAVLGEKKFQSVALAYLKDNPSTSFTLRNLGARLPQWLKEHREFAPRRHRLICDVARLEWTYVESFDGAALSPLTEYDLRGLAADSTLTLQPHLQLIDLQYPVDDLVLAVHRATLEADIVSNAASEHKQPAKLRLPPMQRMPICLAVHRFDNSVYYRRIDREAFAMLSALQRQETLGNALDFAFSDSELAPEEQAQKIQDYFAYAAQLGWFCREQAAESNIQ
jgi:hypothetical protein